MSDKHTNTDTKLPNWIHRLHSAVTNFNVPRPLWLAYLVWKLDNHIKHVRQVGNQPHQRTIASKSGKPAEPDKCGIFTCGSNDQYCYCLTNIRCTDCFDTGYDSSGLKCGCVPNELGWFKCPNDDKHKLCHIDTCTNGKCQDKH